MLSCFMKNVLVVDDNEGIRDIMHLLLKDVCNPLIASSGSEAWMMLNQSRIDLVITDLEMPCGDGRWLMQASQYLEPAPKIVIISGNIHIDEKQLMRDGAIAVFPKPFKAKSLLDFVTSLLSES